ncbi:peptidyl-prolyl cis-trans isomerase SurA [Neisseria sp. HSC-16F19]|nr:peptidylprolyl isomerase [Neisseria sp. HSC-16F19]MCP2040362.1 peptidyl-prolyl cis-trans isomerase SurA [Neisseria sp. HSC-16F19]
MKQFRQWLGAAALACAFQAAAADNIRAVDSIVAVVDNQVITRQDLQHQINQLKRSSKGASEQDIRQQALLNLVNQSLLVQAGARAGMQVTEAEIDAEVARLAAAQKMPVEAFYQRLAREGAKRSQLRRTVADNLMVEKMRQSVTMEKGRVSDAEVAAAIERARQQGVKLPEGQPSYQYQVQHILLKNDTPSTRKLIQQLQAQARGGQSFEQLARQYSQDGSAVQGGNLGWIREGETVAPFEAAVKALKPGQISQPVKSQFGWHIIRLVDVQSADSPEARVFNGMRQALSQERAAQAMEETLRQLHQQALIQIRQ